MFYFVVDDENLGFVATMRDQYHRDSTVFIFAKHNSMNRYVGKKKKKKLKGTKLLPLASEVLNA